MTLTAQDLLNSYYQGIFPMTHDDGEIYWYDPDPRTIIPLEQFHVPRRLARVVRQGKFEIRINHNFRTIMESCAERESTWISSELIALYTLLHHFGFAHSVETWRDGKLVGGLYGVTLRGLFAGESMFSHETDASKVALVHLVERLQQRHYQLLDTQFMTEHLRRFGAIEISRDEYRYRLRKALFWNVSFV